ncbi:hypothetical protein [Natrinema thermotolerans]
MALVSWRRIFRFLPLLTSSIWSVFYPGLWPVLPAGFLVTLLLLLYDNDQLSLRNVVIESIVAGLVYRTTIWVATPSMIGMDPDKYAVAISAVSDRGIGAISDLGFYSSAPIYHLINVIVMEVPGLGPAITLQLTSTVLYAIVPVVTVAHLTTILSGHRAAKLGSILAAAGGSSIIYSTLTIPQSAMLILWYLVAIILIIGQHNLVRTLLLFFFLVIMAGLHKLGVLLPLGGITAIAVIHFTSIIRDGRALTMRHLSHWFLISGLIFGLQMVWLTAWIKGIIAKVVYVVSGITIESTVDTPAATTIDGLDIIFFEHGFWIVLMVAAGITGVWLFYTQTDRKIAGLLGISGTSALVIIGAVASPYSLSLERAIGIGEPFFIILAVMGAVILSKRTNSSVAPVIVALLLVMQLAGASAVPDHPVEVQEYLSDDEIEAKQWANANLDQEIYGNYFVAQEIVNFEGERATYKPGAGGGFPEGWSPASEYLVTGNLSAAEGCFFLRKGENRVQYNGLHQLTYDPIQRLENSNRSNIFENANIVIYC